MCRAGVSFVLLSKFRKQTSVRPVKSQNTSGQKSEYDRSKVKIRPVKSLETYGQKLYITA